MGLSLLYNEFVLGPLAREKCVSRGLVGTVPTTGQTYASQVPVPGHQSSEEAWGVALADFQDPGMSSWEGSQAI